MFRCEICGKEADKHHIVHRCEGGLDSAFNIKYLCSEHHRGVRGPHRCKETDLRYKLELQKKLEATLNQKYYTLNKLSSILGISMNKLKRHFKNYKLYKEGYKTEDIIFILMGKKLYNEIMLEHYYEFIPNYNFA
ncbi:HNH endonuclease [Clostridium oryzae]|uniref:HNH endonuclease n=1 Tax=Clostridium oryzae TaxID=1450648 RepID=A0A1V4IK38_9CLOT|nr:HNH endonuclease signature motif containing protein [Clostridium oryzae]OPJ60381.1 hypothetical protein CLORY_28330 [Clostridium oryzae]